MHARLFAGAKSIELTVRNRNTGELVERHNDSSVTALKKTIRPHWVADFTVVIRASESVGKPILTALGPSMLEESLAGNTDVQLWFQGMDMMGPVWVQLRNEELYGWSGVRVIWPRDPSERYTLVRTGIILIMPMRDRIVGVAPLSLLNKVPRVGHLQ